MTAYLSLGSNLGDPLRNIETGLAMLDAHDLRVLRRSSFYRTEPQGFVDQPWFINIAAEIETSLSAEELLERVLSVERRLGRVRARENGPRTLDIDIVFFGDEVIDTERLLVPHPRMCERRFVLEPLAELAPELKHPITGESVGKLLAKVVGQGVRRLNEL